MQAPLLENVAYLCRRVMSAEIRDLQAMMPSVDVTTGQLGTLILVACNPGITLTEICRAQGFEKPTVSASLDKLERMNFIARKASSADRRSSGLYLEKKGRDFYTTMLRRSRTRDRLLTRSLSGEEREVLISLLRRIYEDQCTDTVRLDVQEKPLDVQEKPRNGRPSAAFLRARRRNFSDGNRGKIDDE